MFFVFALFYFCAACAIVPQSRRNRTLVGLTVLASLLSLSQDLLRDSAPGTFLVRVSESRFGYSLSHMVSAGNRIKHYMIDQTPDGQYQVIGNSKLFPSLNALVSYHNNHKIVSSDPVCLEHPCGQHGDFDDTEELMDKKMKKGRH
eukprot:m.76097 g.76097  ORF g.76097 m.76097 type:complete len:146 (+) comp8104_c0_seq2:25-462(+)